MPGHRQRQLLGPHHRRYRRQWLAPARPGSAGPDRRRRPGAAPECPDRAAGPSGRPRRWAAGPGAVMARTGRPGSAAAIGPWRKSAADQPSARRPAASRSFSAASKATAEVAARQTPSPPRRQRGRRLRRRARGRRARRDRAGDLGPSAASSSNRPQRFGDQRERRELGGERLRAGTASSARVQGRCAPRPLRSPALGAWFVTAIVARPPRGSAPAGSRSPARGRTARRRWPASLSRSVRARYSVVRLGAPAPPAAAWPLHEVAPEHRRVVRDPRATITVPSGARRPGPEPASVAGGHEARQHLRLRPHIDRQSAGSLTSAGRSWRRSISYRSAAEQRDGKVHAARPSIARERFEVQPG